MSTYPVLRLLPGKDVHLRNRHHAVFRAAVADWPDCPNGSIVEVVSSTKDFLCYATFNREAYICGRAIAFTRGDPLFAVEQAMERAIAVRRRFFANEDTNAIRLINAEGDSLPGLIVDQYADVLVVQFTTSGMDALREWICDRLQALCTPRAIFEKSGGTSRKKEGLEPREGWLRGEADPVIDIRERGLKLKIGLVGSQKTGLFLDQRDMRSLVRSLSTGRTVLDCCSYIGGFSTSALLGGAEGVDAVDYDEVALARAKEHVELNCGTAERFGHYREDVFAFLRRRPLPRPYDFIILDPPAFAKRSQDLEPAKKAYTDLNRSAMEMLPPGSLLLTCSCSYQMDAALFQTVVFHAARQAKRGVRIVSRHRQAFDHPVNLFHPEVDYLKSLLLWIE